MSTSDSTVAADEHAGAAASRPLEILFAAVALAFTASYLYLGTQIPLRQEAAPGQIDARFWPLLLGVAGVAVGVDDERGEDRAILVRSGRQRNRLGAKKRRADGK